MFASPVVRRNGPQLLSSSYTVLRELYAILFKRRNAKDAEGAGYSLLGVKGSVLFLGCSLLSSKDLVDSCVMITLKKISNSISIVVRLMLSVSVDLSRNSRNIDL